MFKVRMEDSLLREDANHFVSVLHHEGLTSTTLVRLDQLVTKDLCGSGFSRVLVVLKSLQSLSQNSDDLQALETHGLTTKVLLWFEAVRNRLTSDLDKSSAPLMTLIEEFYNYFLLLAQASLSANQKNHILLQLAQFTLEPKIHFPQRLEAIRTYNSILGSLNREQRKLIQNDQNQYQMLSQVAAAVLTVGDYEMQVSLLEALCRLTPRKGRQQRANQWFSSRDVGEAFCDIRDGDFEVDCRRFLNFVNCYHGNQKRVYTFPCLRAFLNSIQLFQPNDDKLDEFWIDFNIGSGCVSFFIDEPQGVLWESIHLLRDEVDHYSVQVQQDGCTGAEVVLTVHLNNPIMHCSSRGQTVELIFSCEHHRELEEAAERVFRQVKSPPTGGTVQPPPADTLSGRSSSRKKRWSQSKLKVLPLSSPSSEDDSAKSKTPGRSRAEVLFDQIRFSTPVYNSGVVVGMELEISQEQSECGGSPSASQQEVVSSGRKRAADSGYLSDQTEGTASQRRAEPQAEWEESNLMLTDRSVEGAWPSAQEEGLPTEGAESCVPRESPANLPGPDPKSNLTSGISSAFKSFKTQLQQHFTGCRQKVESEVLLSLKECQQQVSSLLTAVHQHRLLLLQRFEDGITNQLNQLEEDSTNLNTVNTEILTFFQSEIQRLGSFCDEHQQRLNVWRAEDQRVSPANDGGEKSSSNQ